MGQVNLGDEQLVVEQVEDRAKPELAKPRMYKVIMVNDDYTPMDFVIEILVKIFNMGEEKAAQVMWQVHTIGEAVCGIFVREIAETKVHEVLQYAKQHEHPLMCRMEAEQ